MNAPTVIVVPGYLDSDPGHWQTLWCDAHPEYRRLAGLDWESPERSQWIEALDDAVAAGRTPVVLVGHSLGAVTIADWARRADDRVLGALLVAPCDTEQADFPAAIRGFEPMPARPLPFPTILVASRTDPWMTFGRATALGGAWGSRLVDAGDAGHINLAAGYGPWPAGERLLGELLAGA